MLDGYKKVIRKIVERDPKKLKFDPNQPRKEYSEEEVDNIGKTYDSQGVINEPEIDENDNVITGEIRVRGAIKKGLVKIKCKLITGLDKDGIFERQVIENLHHNILTAEEQEGAITKLWKSGKYKTKVALGNVVGLNSDRIGRLLQAYKIRKNLKIRTVQKISTKILVNIAGLPEDEQKKVINKIEAGEISKYRIQEYASVIRSLPEDLRSEYLKVGTPIDFKMVKTIAQFSEEEQRAEMIAEVIYIDKMKQDSVQYHLDIAQGKIPKKMILENPMKLRMKRLLDIKFKIFNNFSNEYLNIIDIQEYRQEAYKIMREIYNFLRQELEKVNDVSIRKIIEVKEV